MSYTEPNIKRKNQSPLRVLVNAWGCLLGLVMLGLGGAIGLLGALFVAPQLLGFTMTATALAEREIVLASTAVDLEARARDAEAQATSFAFLMEATQANLLNEYELLGQTATQSAQNIRATGTANAENSLVRQTQIASDYLATQVQLQAEAAQVEINFRNTQDAFNASQNNNSLLNPTSSPSPTNPYDFRLGLDTNIWEASNLPDWQASQNGLIVMRENAWLLEQENALLPTGDFTLELNFQHSNQANSEYWLLIVSNEANLAVQFKAEGITVVEAAFYSFDLATLESGALGIENSRLISRVAAQIFLADSTTVELIRERDWLRVVLDGQVLLLAEQAPLINGRFGLQMPLGAVVQNVERR